MGFDSNLVLLLSTTRDDEQTSRLMGKLRRMADYPAGWSHGEGERISLDAIQTAKSLVLWAELLDLAADVFPNLDGGCAVAFYNVDERLEVNVDSSGAKLNLHVERGIGFDYEVITAPTDDVTRDELIEQLLRLRNLKIWKLSEFSTFASSIGVHGVSEMSSTRTPLGQPMHRPLQMVKGGSQSSTLLVPVLV